MPGGRGGEGGEAHLLPVILQVMSGRCASSSAQRAGWVRCTAAVPDADDGVGGGGGGGGGQERVRLNVRSRPI